MKKLLLLASVLAVTLPGMASAETNVGVSISVGQPGFYGTIDIGNAPPPVLYAPQPVMIQPMPPGMAPLPPIYLYVPPGHRRDWRHHCAEYNACGRQVYFVKEGWYNKVYVPYYQQHRDYYEGRRGYEDHRPEGRGPDGRGGERERMRDEDPRR